MQVYKIKAYNYNELSKEAQSKAVNDYIKFIIEITPYEDASANIKKAIDKSEAMRTPWFVGEYIWEYAKEEILQGLADGIYTRDGGILPCEAYI